MNIIKVFILHPINQAKRNVGWSTDPIWYKSCFRIISSIWRHL